MRRVLLPALLCLAVLAAAPAGAESWRDRGREWTRDNLGRHPDMKPMEQGMQRFSSGQTRGTGSVDPRRLCQIRCRDAYKAQVAQCRAGESLSFSGYCLQWTEGQTKACLSTCR